MSVSKSRYWCGVLYPENMIENWVDKIGELLQVPFAYCLHDKDNTNLKEEHRKSHVHCIIVFNNTTTYNHAFNVFDSLSKFGCRAINKCEACISIRYMYDYLIHDTETARKENKYLYSLDERIQGNNFDIGSFEQLSLTDKNKLIKELADFIIKKQFCNFVDFYSSVFDEYHDSGVFEVLKSNSGFLDRLVKGNYHKYQSNLAKEMRNEYELKYHDFIDKTLNSL